MTSLPLRALLLAALIAAPHVVEAQSRSRDPAPVRTHRVVVQVTQNDPALMNTALNNVENMARHYEARNERLEVELVAYGPGLHMMRSDTSPVKERLTSLVAGRKGVTLSGCANTMATQSRQEGREITLVPEAKMVSAGIARIVELQERGWVYVRP